MKKGEFIPDEAAFDLFHDAIKITRGLLSGERTPGMSPAESCTVTQGACFRNTGSPVDSTGTDRYRFMP